MMPFELMPAGSYAGTRLAADERAWKRIRRQQQQRQHKKKMAMVIEDSRALAMMVGGEGGVLRQDPRDCTTAASACGRIGWRATTGEFTSANA